MNQALLWNNTAMQKVAHRDPWPALVSERTKSDVAPSTVPISIFLPDDDSRMEAELLVTVLKAANEFSPRPLYSWELSTLSALVWGGAAGSSRTSIFLGGSQNLWSMRRQDRARLSKVLRFSDRIVLVGGAVFLPRQVQMKVSNPLAIHPNFMAAASEESLGSRKSEGHIVTTGRIRSATTGFAAVHLLLAMVAEDAGPYLASVVAEHLGIGNDQHSQPSPCMARMIQAAKGDTQIATILKLMHENIEEPLTVAQLADHLNVSERQLQRRTRAKLKLSPLMAYRLLKLEHAEHLLRQTDISLAEVAIASGFESQTQFSRWFKKVYGESPLLARERAFQV